MIVVKNAYNQVVARVDNLKGLAASGDILYNSDGTSQFYFAGVNDDDLIKCDAIRFSDVKIIAIKAGSGYKEDESVTNLYYQEID